jgi:hypothetical protein
MSVRQALQERGQGGTVRTVESGEQVSLMGFGDAAQLGEHVLALARERQDVRPPIRGMPPADDQVERFELVDQRDDPARESAEPTGQGALVELGLPGDEAQDAGVRRHEPQRGDPLGEAPRGMRAELRQQERRARARAAGRARVGRGTVRSTTPRLPTLVISHAVMLLVPVLFTC